MMVMREGEVHSSTFENDLLRDNSNNLLLLRIDVERVKSLISEEVT